MNKKFVIALLAVFFSVVSGFQKGQTDWTAYAEETTTTKTTTTSEETHGTSDGSSYSSSETSTSTTTTTTSTPSTTSEDSQAPGKVYPATFLGKVEALLDDALTQLATARVDVPKRVSGPKEDQILQERSSIIFARLVLSNDLADLKILIGKKPAKNAAYPKLTLANVAILTNLYKAAAPSYIVGSNAKSRWKKFASKLASVAKT